MMAGQSKLSRKNDIAQGGKLMQKAHDRVAVKFWKNQDNPDMNNKESWKQLVKQLRAQSAQVGISSLKKHWIERIDPWMARAYKVNIKDRKKLGYRDDMSEVSKFKIMSKRMTLLKEAMAEKMAHKTELCEKSTVLQEKGTLELQAGHKTSSRPELTHDYKIMNKKGSASVDVKECNLPVQIFEGKNFYLLDVTPETIRRELVFDLGCTIKVHGGIVVRNSSDITDETIVIGSSNNVVNYFGFPGHKIYKPELIFWHANKVMGITDDSLENFVIGSYQSVSPGNSPLEGYKDSKDLVSAIPWSLDNETNQQQCEQIEQCESVCSEDSHRLVIDLDNFVFETPILDDKKGTLKKEATSESTNACPVEGWKLQEMRGFFALFKAAKICTFKRELYTSAVYAYKTLYGEDVPRKTFKEWASMMVDVTYRYEECRASGFSLEECHRQEMIKIMGFDKWDGEHNTDDEDENLSCES